MKTKIIGRLKEQALLRQLLQSAKAEFLALYGRRRVGKTFLIRNYFQSTPCIFFYASGLKDGKLADQIEEFNKHIGKTFYAGATLAKRKKWKDTFEDLNNAIATVSPSKKIVLFFDELPWMATPRSGLLQAIDYYWNRYWSHDSRIKLIVCGSSASWIINKIINNKGGLYNRVTRTLKLHPFNLVETKTFLTSLGMKFNNKQLLEIYMVLGGIPHYLSMVRKGISVGQCIDELCFQSDGALTNEFDRLFSSLFNDPESYIQLIRTISKSTYGLGLAQVIKESGASDGGRLKQKLKELEDAGFLYEFIPYGHKEKGLYYKITDEFTLFFLRWVEPNLKTISKQIQSHGYWLAKAKSPHWRSWTGLAFEAICYKHLVQIRKTLDIGPGTDVGNWRYAPRNANLSGAQIDLLFDRDDDAITICEIKYNEQPFVIDKEYAKKILNKVETYKKQTGTQKQIFIVMITANGLKPTMYSEEIISMVVSLEDLFKEI